MTNTLLPTAHGTVKINAATDTLSTSPNVKKLPKTSDPYLCSIKRKKKRNKQAFSKETLNLMLPNENENHPHEAIVNKNN